MGVLKDTSNVLPPTPTKTPTKRRLQEDPNTPLPQEQLTPNKKICPSILSPEATPKKNVPSSLEIPVPASVYRQAKSLFQRGSAQNMKIDHLVGRHEEAQHLKQFFTEHLTANTSGSLYISGPPGTGKTAQLTRTLEYYRHPFRDDYMQMAGKTACVVNINCMIVQSPELIFQEIMGKLVKKVHFGKRQTCEHLGEYLKQGKCDAGHLLIVLDEMDALLTRDQQVLFDVFNLAKMAQSYPTQVIIVGIANALDFTDKFLPRLKRTGQNPKNLSFMPYTWEQIKQVVTHKLQQLPVQLFHPMAIQLCCKKALLLTGDLRKALDVCYKAVETVELEYNRNLSPFVDPPPLLLVSISHMARICALAFGTPLSLKLTALNMLQKMVLCCLTHCAANITIHEFYVTYRHIMSDRAEGVMGTLKKSEFLEVVSALEAMAVVNLSVRGKLAEMSNRQIKINVPHDELAKSVQGMGILMKLLH